MRRSNAAASSRTEKTAEDDHFDRHLLSPFFNTDGVSPNSASSSSTGITVLPPHATSTSTTARNAIAPRVNAFAEALATSLLARSSRSPSPSSSPEGPQSPSAPLLPRAPNKSKSSKSSLSVKKAVADYTRLLHPDLNHRHENHERRHDKRHYEHLVPCASSSDVSNAAAAANEAATTPQARSMCPAPYDKNHNGEENACPVVADRLLPKPQRSAHRLVLLLTGALVLLLLAAAVIVFTLYHVFVPRTCLTMGCVKAAASLEEKMDRSVDPCDNFFMYACSRWINTTASQVPPPNSWHLLAETGVGALDELANTIEKIRNRQLAVELSAGEEAVVQLHGQCIDVEALQKRGLVSWLEMIEKLGGWRLNDLLTSPDLTVPNHILEDLYLSAYKLSSFPLFWIGVDVNYLNTKEHIITIEEQVPLLPYPQLYDKALPAAGILSNDMSQWLQMIKESGLHMASLAGLNRDSEEVQVSIARALEFEVKLVAISSAHERRRDHDKYNITTLGHLQRLLPAIDWNYFLDKLFGRDFDPNQPIAIKAGMRWLIDFSQLLNEYVQDAYGMKTLEDYIKWRVLLLGMAFTDIGCSNGGNRNPSLQSLVQLYVGTPNMRLAFCLTRLSGHFPLSISALLRRTGHADAVKNRQLLRDTFTAVRSEYREMIESSVILDDSTRRLVLNKLNNMSFQAVYPDEVDNVAALNREADEFYADDAGTNDFFWLMIRAAARKSKRVLGRLPQPVSRTKWIDSFTSITLNAIYNFETNAFYYPLALTRRNFVDHTKPNFITFAGGGTILGHEMTHAFDNQGRFYGATGSLGEHWSESSASAFDNNTKCFVDHYAQLKGGGDVHRQISSTTLSENVADMVGLQVAYRAFMKHNDIGSQRVPGLSLTAEQAFFVNFAQNWCAIPSQRGGAAAADVHSTEELRVLGPLQNMPEFAAAFQCPIGSPMNPVGFKPCDVF